MAVALSHCADLMSTSVLAMVGAFLTPVLMNSDTDRQTALMVYLLIVDAGFLVLGTIKRWRPVAPVAWVGTAILFTAWMVTWFGPDKAPTTTLRRGYRAVNVFIESLLPYGFEIPGREGCRSGLPGHNDYPSPAKKRSPGS